MEIIDKEGGLQFGNTASVLAVAKALVDANEEKRGYLTVTKTEDGKICAVTRTDEEHRILRVIAEND